MSELEPGAEQALDADDLESLAADMDVEAADNTSLADEDYTGGGGVSLGSAGHLDDQLGEDSGVEEALQAWEEGGHALEEFDGDDQIASVRFPQLEPAVPKVRTQPNILNNVWVAVSVELGRKDMTVLELSNLKGQDVIELDKLAGEAFEVRVNGRLFAAGEVVVVSDMMAVRLTSLIQNPDTVKEQNKD